MNVGALHDISNMTASQSKIDGHKFDLQVAAESGM
jgi:hypothetical protein